MSEPWGTESQKRRQMIVHNPDHSSNEGKFLARAAAIRCFHAPPMRGTRYFAHNQELSSELPVNGRLAPLILDS